MGPHLARQDCVPNSFFKGGSPKDKGQGHAFPWPLKKTLFHEGTAQLGGKSVQYSAFVTKTQTMDPLGVVKYKGAQSIVFIFKCRPIKGRVFLWDDARNSSSLQPLERQKLRTPLRPRVALE